MHCHVKLVEQKGHFTIKKKTKKPLCCVPSAGGGPARMALKQQPRTNNHYLHLASVPDKGGLTLDEE